MFSLKHLLVNSKTEARSRRPINGVCHEIFDLHFFHGSNPFRHLINRLKYFQIRCRFCRYIQIYKSSAVCIILQSQALRCSSYRRVKFRGVNPTKESSSAVCLTPWSQVIKSFFFNFAVCISLRSRTPRCASFRRVELNGVHHTADSDSALCITPRSE